MGSNRTDAEIQADYDARIARLRLESELRADPVTPSREAVEAPFGVLEAMQLAEAAARGPFWQELQRAEADLAAAKTRLRRAEELLGQGIGWAADGSRVVNPAARAFLAGEDQR